MKSPSLWSTIRAFAWPLWANGRWLYVGGFALLLVLAGAMHVADARSVWSSHAVPFPTFGGSVLTGSYVLVALVLSLAPVLPMGRRVASSGQGSPTALVDLALPVSTRRLVLIPLSFGVAGFSGLWLLLVMTTVVPLGLAVDLRLPILVAFACIVSMQAAMWAASAHAKYLRFSLVPFMVVGFDPFSHFFTKPEPIRSIVLVLVSLVSLAALLGLAPSVRRGTAWTARARRDALKGKREAVRESRQFESPMSAQSWFDQSPHRLLTFLPLALPVCMYILYRIIIGSATNYTGMNTAEHFQALGMWNIKVAMGTGSAFTFIPFLVLLYSVTVPNGCLGLSSKWQDAKNLRAMSTFLSVRPITTAQLVVGRLCLAGKGAILISPFVILVIASAFAKMGLDGGRFGTLASLIATHLAGRGPILGALLALCTPFLIWTLQSGNPLQGARNLFFNGLQVLVFLGFLFWITRIELTWQLHPGRERGALHLAWIVGWIVLGAKAVAAAAGVRRSRALNLVCDRTLANGAKIWIAAAVILTTAFYIALPPGTIALPTLILIIALLLPANRILWQIITLDATRHL
jgi:hypothetical protein